jgi:DNA-binding MarR family transcriptional regulator
MTTTESDDLTDALVQSAFTVMAVLNKTGAEHDLSLTQLRVMAILRDRRLRMSALSNYLGLDRSSLTGLVDRAAGRGLLERAPNPQDGRAIDVFLTADGRKLADRLYADVSTTLSERASSLTGAEQQRLQTLLRKLIGAEPG